MLQWVTPFQLTGNFSLLLKTIQIEEVKTIRGEGSRVQEKIEKGQFEQISGELQPPLSNVEEQKVEFHYGYKQKSLVRSLENPCKTQWFLGFSVETRTEQLSKLRMEIALLKSSTTGGGVVISVSTFLEHLFFLLEQWLFLMGIHPIGLALPSPLPQEV